MGASDEKNGASFLSSSMDDVEYPAGGDFFFSKIVVPKEMDSVAKRAETLVCEKYLSSVDVKKEENVEDDGTRAIANVCAACFGKGLLRQGPIRIHCR